MCAFFCRCGKKARASHRRHICCLLHRASGPSGAPRGDLRVTGTLNPRIRANQTLLGPFARRETGISHADGCRGSAAVGRDRPRSGNAVDPPGPSFSHHHRFISSAQTGARGCGLSYGGLSQHSLTREKAKMIQRRIAKSKGKGGKLRTLLLKQTNLSFRRPAWPKADEEGREVPGGRDGR